MNKKRLSLTLLASLSAFCSSMARGRNGAIIDDVIIKGNGGVKASLNNVTRTNRSLNVGDPQRVRKAGQKKKVKGSFSLNSERQDLSVNKRTRKLRSKGFDKAKQYRNPITEEFINTNLANDGSSSSSKGWWRGMPMWEKVLVVTGGAIIGGGGISGLGYGGYWLYNRFFGFPTCELIKNCNFDGLKISNPRYPYEISVRYKREGGKDYFHTYHFHLVFNKEQKNVNENNCYVFWCITDEDGSADVDIKNILLYESDLDHVPKEEIAICDRNYLLPKKLPEGGTIAPVFCGFNKFVIGAARFISESIFSREKNFMSDKDSNKLYSSGVEITCKSKTQTFRADSAILGRILYNIGLAKDKAKSIYFRALTGSEIEKLKNSNKFMVEKIDAYVAFDPIVSSAT